MGFPDVALERVIPSDVIRTFGKVLLVEDLEPNFHKSIASLLDRSHLRDTVANLDLVSQFLVLRDGWVPSVSHGPLVNTELKIQGKHE